MDDETTQEKRGDAVREVRDGWRSAHGFRPEQRHGGGRNEPESEDAHEQRRTASLDSLDRIRADAPDGDLETRRAADAAEREIQGQQRRQSRPASH